MGEDYCLFRAMPPRKQGVGWSCQKGRRHFGASGRGNPRELLEASSPSAACRDTGSSFDMRPSDDRKGQTQSWWLLCAKSRMAVTDGSDGVSRGPGRSRLAEADCLTSVWGICLAFRRDRCQYSRTVSALGVQSRWLCTVIAGCRMWEGGRGGIVGVCPPGSFREVRPCWDVCLRGWLSVGAARSPISGRPQGTQHGPLVAYRAAAVFNCFQVGWQYEVKFWN